MLPRFHRGPPGVWKAIVCWLFFVRMSTTVTGPPVPYDVGRGETDRVIAHIRQLRLPESAF